MRLFNTYAGSSRFFISLIMVAVMTLICIAGAQASMVIAPSKIVMKIDVDNFTTHGTCRKEDRAQNADTGLREGIFLANGQK